ncbi:MAG: hypothetical protein AUI52_04755 [Acidobacteria bacterium 13_1_40CM_2_68_10]|nr:MAG: hypothetical protein AUI52_04755 [Acidobacteria bacterium 13_1_40CM_2_68_10]
MRGASALQDLLRRSPDASLRVFVVWEPVIWSDLAPPLTTVLRRVSDHRAAQLWDRGRLVSADLLRAIRAQTGEADSPGRDDDTIVWDCVAIYPPGARWDTSLPPPAFIDCPVVAVIDEAGRRLSSPSAVPGR